MTVSSSTNKVSYSGNGSLTTFAYSFKIFDQDDLTVILRAADGTETTQTITTHYTVSGVGEASGGNVVFGSAPASGVTVVIIREQPLTQGLDLVPNNPFPAESLEEALDKLTFMSQKHEEELSRAIKGSRTNTITNSEFTVSATDRANKVFAFDGSGDLSVTQELGTFKGNWAASTAYVPRDIVKDTSTNNIFLVNTAHTSSGSQPLTTNANSAKYDLIVDAASSTTAQTASASSATAAASSATAAANSATAAQTAQTASETAKTASETAKTASETAKTASETAKTAAETALDSFDDRYLGAKSTSGGNPTVDNDGDALIDGALFFDTTNNVLMVYNLGTTTWLRTTPTSSDQTAINAVNADASDIGTVSSNISAVNTVATNISTISQKVSKSGDTLTGSLRFADNIAAFFGTGDDAQITHDGSNTFFRDTGAGSLFIGGDAEVAITNSASTEFKLKATTDGSVELYHDGSKKIETTATGIDVTGNATFADNNKAIFGAGSDLQIYHDGSNSYIQDVGTGGLYLKANSDFYVQSQGTDETFIQAASNAFVKLFYNGSEKLATTATGIDVTGTITADQIVVSNSSGATLNINTSGAGVDAKILLHETTTASSEYGASLKYSGANNRFEIGTGQDPETKRLSIDRDTGDISFYEDTGTTAKLFWDASAESLGIGTVPTTALHVLSGTGNSDVAIFSGANASRGLKISTLQGGAQDEGVEFDAHGGSTGFHKFSINGSERMRIDSSGNFNVGATAYTGGSSTTQGGGFLSTGTVFGTRDGNEGGIFNRLTSDGDIVAFRKNGSTVGSIGTSTNTEITLAGQDAGIGILDYAIVPTRGQGVLYRNSTQVDLGRNDTLFKDLYLSGGVYLGGTGSANKLEDYEEGTWTPVITPESGSAASITVNHASYTKVGRLVSVVFDVTIDSISGTNSSYAIELTGMPFNSATSHGGGPNIGYANLAGSMTGTLALTAVSTSKYRIVNLNGSSGLNASDHLQATSRLEAQFTYHTT